MDEMDKEGRENENSQIMEESDYKSQRARGKCVLSGEIVRGEQKACVLFKGRE